MFKNAERRFYLRCGYLRAGCYFNKIILFDIFITLLDIKRLHEEFRAY
jgi:hypothetical protein